MVSTAEMSLMNTFTRPRCIWFADRGNMDRDIDYATGVKNAMACWQSGWRTWTQDVINFFACAHSKIIFRVTVKREPKHHIIQAAGPNRYVSLDNPPLNTTTIDHLFGCIIKALKTSIFCDCLEYIFLTHYSNTTLVHHCPHFVLTQALALETCLVPKWQSFMSSLHSSNTTCPIK